MASLKRILAWILGLRKFAPKNAMRPQHPGSQVLGDGSDEFRWGLESPPFGAHGGFRLVSAFYAGGNEVVTAPNRLDQLASALSGSWEYMCEVQDAPYFDYDEVSRGGEMLINTTAHELGVEAQIAAQRLWSETMEGNVRRKQALERPVLWSTDHAGIMFQRNRMLFRYVFLDSGDGGETADSFLLNDNSMELPPGTFIHVRRDGQRVKGVVRLRRKAERRDFVWAPPDVASQIERVPLPSRGEKAENEKHGGTIVINSVNTASGAGSTAAAGVGIGPIRNTLITETKSIPSTELQAAAEALIYALDASKIPAEDRAIATGQVEGLIDELRKPTPNKGRVSRILDGVKSIVPAAAEVVVLAEKIKQLLS